MKSIFLFLFLGMSGWLSPVPHDAPIGIFQLYLNTNKVWMDVHLDKDDLEAALATSTEDMSGAIIQEYLDTHFQLSLNAKTAPLEVCSFESDELHIFIHTEFPVFTKKITSIEVHNTCLIDIEQKQSNLVHVNGEDGRRSFRLHRGRKELSLDF